MFRCCSPSKAEEDTEALEYKNGKLVTKTKEKTVDFGEYVAPKTPPATKGILKKRKDAPAAHHDGTCIIKYNNNRDVYLYIYSVSAYMG